MQTFTSSVYSSTRCGLILLNLGWPVDSAPLRRNEKSLAVALSGVAHIVTAILLVTALSTNAAKTKPLHRQFQVMLMHLQPSSRDISHLHYSATKRRSPMPKRVSPTPGKSSRERQTLLVSDAPTDVVLSKAIPLPLLVPEPKGVLPTPLPSVLSTFRANILSVPNKQTESTGTVLIPRVRQSASGVGESPLVSPETSNQSSVVRSLDGDSGVNPFPTDTAEETQEETGKLTRLELAANGRFSASVLGPSLTEQYPDLKTNLTGKVVSTVYLPVGLKKNWPLEFWAAGSPMPDAPWAIQIFLPEKLDLPTDHTVLIRGSIEENGKFASLELLMPSEWPPAQNVLRALQHWTFRPAMRNGKPIRVEVLLVIPRTIDY